MLPAISLEYSHGHKHSARMAAEIDRVGRGAQFNGQFDVNLLAVLDGLKAAGGWLKNSERLISDLYDLSAGGIAARVGSSVAASGFGRNVTLTATGRHRHGRAGQPATARRARPVALRPASAGQQRPDCMDGS